MDLSSLAALGKIAGVGGIAIGAVVLLVRPMIGQVPSLPSGERAPTLRFVAIGAFGIGALGLMVWLISGLQPGVTVTASGGSVAAGGNISGPVSANGASQPLPVAKLP